MLHGLLRFSSACITVQYGTMQLPAARYTPLHGRHEQLYNMLSTNADGWMLECNLRAFAGVASVRANLA